MNSLQDKAYYEAVNVLKKASTPHGFYAAYPGYDMVFGRDAMIMSLGASLVNEDKELRETFKQSLITLSENQSKKGQIPNAIDKFTKRKHHVDFKSIDSTLWFIIGHHTYKQQYRDSSLIRKYKKEIEKALIWLSFQDMGEDGMLEQLPTTDWQDAFPHRYGHTINTQALYHKVLVISKKTSTAKKLNHMTNYNKDDGLWDEKKGFYIPWRWKNHNNYLEKGEWFDSLGNFLAIIYGLASKTQTKKILAYVKKAKVDKPFPVKAIFPPIRKGTKDWQDYFLDSDAGTPYHYLNGGIWTYIGGFYVLALVKAKQFREAERQLENLAKANMKEPIFNEWLDGKTGKIGAAGSGSNGNQGWNAAMYIAAYESVKRKKCLV